jgi:hypothetical protein
MNLLHFKTVSHINLCIMRIIVLRIAMDWNIIYTSVRLRVTEDSKGSPFHILSPYLFFQLEVKFYINITLLAYPEMVG